MDSKITIGVTGGIGSGKSVVCRIISTLGYPVFYADKEAKNLYFQDEIRTAVVNLFGTDSYTDEGLNKAFLAQQIYSDQQLKLKLENIIHPAVRAHFKNWVKLQSESLTFAEAAILFETGSYKNYDYTILVTSPLELRISRTMNRDALSREEVQERIDNQWSDERKAELADFIIKNDEQSLLISQVNTIIEKIRKIENL